MTAFVHETAIIEDGVEIGDGTSVWDNVHIRGPARIGTDCTIGEKTYVAYGVEIADRVKVNAFVYICNGVKIETGAMVSAGTVFTNDPYPRATTPDLSRLRSSAPHQHNPTLVREGATIGARSVIGCNLEIGRFAMVGMGSIVTRSVPDFHLVVGQPSVSIGLVCRCGARITRFEGAVPATLDERQCHTCGSRYAMRDGRVVELSASPPDRQEP